MVTLTPTKLYALLSLLLGVSVVLSLFAGRVYLTPFDIWHMLMGDADILHSIIVEQIRLPRIVAGLLVGWALGISGAAIQALLRNPLAEPMLLGAGNMAALGAVIMIYIGSHATTHWAVPVAATGGALLSVILLFILIGQKGNTIRFILAGFALSAGAGAAISLALNLAPNPFAALEIAYWLLGSLENRSWAHIFLAVPFICAGSFLLLAQGRKLDALVLGEATAHSLGVSLSRLYWHYALGLALCVGACVALAGVVGFVGLIVPHIMRPFCAGLPARSLVASGLFGGFLVLAADSFIRLIPTPVELKLGVVTAFIGVPVFLILLLRDKWSNSISG